MNITVSKSDLSKGLQLAQSISDKKSSMPILNNVLLQAEGDQLRICSTNLDITAVTLVNAQINTPGKTTVSARIISDVVKELPDGDILLKLTDDTRLEVHSHNTNLKVVCIDPDGFPELPGMEIEPSTQISSKLLSEMVANTLYAVSTDETRFNLNGVCFSNAGGKDLLRLVATDGHRLALIDRGVKGIVISNDVIVPRKGLNELKRILDGIIEEQKVLIDITEEYLIVDAGETKLSIRLIDGEFPDYNQVIPDGEGEVVSFLAGDLIHSMRRVAIMVSDKNKCVKMDFESDNLRMHSSSPELGEAVEEMAVSYVGDPVSVGFNARYLIDLASTIGETKVIKMELHGSLGPAKFYSEEDDSCFGIVMPMRLA